MRILAFAVVPALLLAGCTEVEQSDGESALPEVAAPDLSVETMKSITEELSSDAYEGRAPGTAGEEKATKLISEKFAEAGLAPGNGDSWFQDVPLVGYALLGCCWLIWKTEGPLQRQCYSYAGRLGILLLVAIGIVSIATPFLEAEYYTRWLAYPGVLATAQIPLATLIVSVLFFRSLSKKQEATPFFYALGLFGLSLVGLAVSMWPDVIPGRVTIWEAAAPYESQLFMLVGAVIMVPIILAYTAWSYWVFRGKVGSDGYH